MKFSSLSTLALAAIASAAPFFGAKSYQVKDDTDVSNSVGKSATTINVADAYFSTSFVKGSISIDNKNNLDVVITGLPPSRNIAIAVTATTDFSQVKTSLKCDFDNSTPKSTIIVDVPVNKNGIADANLQLNYNGSNLVDILNGLGVVILQDRQFCPDGVIIAGAPIEVHASSTTGKATKDQDVSLQQFLDSKSGSQSGSSVAMNRPAILVESHFYSKITGSVNIDASGNVIASLYGLPPNRPVIVAITEDGHKEFKTSVVCNYDKSNPESYELVQFVADKDGRVDGVKSYKLHGTKEVQDVEPKEFIGHDIVLYHDQQFCPGGVPMAVGYATKA
ncbi:UNVERIFIED_CONTAM: hypothetical protein HDU68_006310 [Siphonaria sp. JEL0065]|nr:hypothetical protein HDU68_006310 [Siphonaria sp. JEL0065]